MYHRIKLIRELPPHVPPFLVCLAAAREPLGSAARNLTRDLQTALFVFTVQFNSVDSHLISVASTPLTLKRL